MRNNNATLSVGSVLRSAAGEYEIIKVVAADESGVTYMATSRGGAVRSSTVVVREFFPQAESVRSASGSMVEPVGYAADSFASALTDFIAEARKLQTVTGMSDNLAGIIDVFEANGTAYFVAEWLEGPTLAQLIESNGAVDENRMLDLLLPIVSGAAAMHSADVVHIDIKPSNIVIATDDLGRERPVLVAPGMSSSAGASDGFSPIEKYAGLTKFSPASDVYSLGATMLYCMSGRKVPAAAEITRDTLAALLAKNISPELSNVLLEAMAFRIADRPATATVFHKKIMDATGRQWDTTPAPAPAFVPPVEEAPAPPPAYVAPADVIPAVAPAAPSVAPPAVAPSVAPVPPVAPMAPMVNQDVPPIAPQPTPVAPVAPIAPAPAPMPAPGYPYGYAEEPDPEVDRKSSHTIVYIIIGVIVAAALGFGAYMLIQHLDSKKKTSSKSENVIDDKAWNDYGEDGGSRRIGGSVGDGRKSDGRSNGSAFADDNSSRSSYEPALTERGRYDMLFHQLVPGTHVKSLTVGGQTFTFSPEGEWTNQYYVDTLHDRAWDFEGSRRSSESYTTSDGMRGTMYYTWEGSRLTEMYDPARGFTVYRDYDSDGRCLSSTTMYHDGRDSKTISYHGYSTDSHGNWVSRKNSRGSSETRLITYYE